MKALPMTYTVASSKDTSLLHFAREDESYLLDIFHGVMLVFLNYNPRIHRANPLLWKYKMLSTLTQI